MAVTNFVPDIWSARILSNLSTTAVAAGICNRDYEGDASVGDSVKITSFTDPTIGTYTGAAITPEAISDATRSLLLDQKKYFDFELDDVERAQSVNGAAVLVEQINRASYGLSNTLDAYVLDLMGSGVSTSSPDHLLTQAAIDTAAEAYDLLVKMAALLDEADIPQESRWAVVTPGFYGLMLKDSRFVAAGDAMAAGTRANGVVGQAAGLTLHKSNNLPDGSLSTNNTSKLILAGSTYATTLAEQVRDVEPVRDPYKFADRVRGLHVYGAKVTRSTAIVAADCVVTL
jgi:hypothetical protein